VFRDSLIGLAPLVAGGLFLAYASIDHLKLLLLWQTFQNGQIELFLRALKVLPSVNDFPLWFYLTFAVSSTMLPSASDRHAWTPLAVWIVSIFALALVAGAGPLMLTYVAPSLNSFLQSVAMLFGLSVAVHAILILPTFLIHKFLARLLKVDIA
jgi:hypothetical protein